MIMARSVPWRRVCPDGVSWHQDQAINTVIYILRETGPTGFLLKEEGETKKFKVYLGDPHSCTCPTFKKEKDLCKHICWVLLKKFRVPRQNPVTWQHGLVEREINEILRGIAANQKPKPNSRAKHLAHLASDGDEKSEEGGGESGTVSQRPISDDDVCPICQEELLDKHLPVTYCRFGCGNSVHIKCMKVWGDHQQSTGEKVIKCPFCREDFGPFSLLKQEFRNTSVRQTRAENQNQHLGSTCKRCRACPISGKCYKCSVCAEYYLCQACFNTPTHQEHNFQYREKCNQRWRPAARTSGATLPPAVIESLQGRDISATDYDLLLQLDRPADGELSDLTEETVRSLPIERVRRNSPLLAPGQQCRVCLQRFQDGQYVRRLPCRHKFHRDCIDNWLLHQHPTCPIDGATYSNESIQQFSEAARARRRHSSDGPSSQRRTSLPSQEAGLLEIPGLGLARLGNIGTTDGVILSGTRVNPPPRRENTGSWLSEPDIIISGRRYGSSAQDTVPFAHGSTNPALQSPSRGRPALTFSPTVLLNRTRAAAQTAPQARTGSAPSEQSGGLEGLVVPCVPLVHDVARIDYLTNPAESSSPGRNEASMSTAPTYVPSIEPVAPSIPHRHMSDRELDLDVTNSAPADSAPNSASGSHRKPPTGAHGISGTDMRRTRARGRAPHSVRPRSSSIERTTANRAPRERDLYVGSDPSTVAGFTSNFRISNGPSRKASRPSHDAPSDSRHRWGTTQEYSGQTNDILLAGSALSNIVLQDS